MHVRRASGAMGAVVSKEIAELVRDEFASVVTLQRADHVSRRGTLLVQESSERCHKTPDMSRSLGRVLQEMDGFES
eukprot:6173167-Pleurochrysis_carterae.AAC.5